MTTEEVQTYKPLPTALTVHEQMPALLDFARRAWAARGSGMIPKHLKSEGEVLVAILRGAELGISPVSSLSAFHVVEGRCCADYSTWVGLLKRSGYRIKWLESTATVATVRLTGPDGEVNELSYTIEQAQRAGLAGKDNWKKHPETMLRARAITALGRACAAEVMAGCYDTDEADEIRATSHRVLTDDEGRTGMDRLEGKLGIAAPPAEEPAPADPGKPEPFASSEDAIAIIDEADSEDELRFLTERLKATKLSKDHAAACKAAVVKRLSELREITDDERGEIGGDQ